MAEQSAVRFAGYLYEAEKGVTLERAAADLLRSTPPQPCWFTFNETVVRVEPGMTAIDVMEAWHRRRAGVVS
jgi:hypothetical protein